MEIDLSEEEKIELERRHRSERDSRICDRIKAILLRHEGWSVAAICQALRLHHTTVLKHLSDYRNSQKLKPSNGGSKSKLNEGQREELATHIEENCYTKVKEICAYVLAKYKMKYTVAGMNSLLIKLKFVYKGLKETPAKANMEAQEAFVAEYKKIKRLAGIFNEPMLFIDSVHPTQATKACYGWIKKGKEKLIKSTSSRTRLNITGAININSMDILVKDYKTINGETTVEFLGKILDELYPKARKIHVFLDQSGYHTSALVAEFVKANKRLCLHFLPPYSPNLNPIERLWKVMNEHARNNRYFASVKEFKESIGNFFEHTYETIAASLKSRINDNFHILSPASSF